MFPADRTAVGPAGTIAGFRAKSFNILNHPAFTGINTTARFDAAGNPTAGFGAVNVPTALERSGDFRGSTGTSTLR